jgi:hypothetical protein
MRRGKERTGVSIASLEQYVSTGGRSLQLVENYPRFSRVVVTENLLGGWHAVAGDVLEFIIRVYQTLALVEKFIAEPEETWAKVLSLVNEYYIVYGDWFRDLVQGNLAYFFKGTLTTESCFRCPVILIFDAISLTELSINSGSRATRR